MRGLTNQWIRAAGAALSVIVLSGCAVNMKVPIKDPAPSGVAYRKASPLEPAVLTFKDDQTADDKAKLLTGVIPMQLVQNDKAFEAVPWIARQTAQEMVARGLPVRLAADGQAATAIAIKRVHIENHRASGFGPFVTFTSLRADVMTPRGPQRITAYVKRGKVPVWSFDEIIDPTFNDPLGVLTKELAAKLNQLLFRQSISNEQVAAIVAKIAQDGGKSESAYLDVYQLGFGNNPSAVPELVKLVSHANEYVRLAALSSLGILKATDQMNFLIGRYEATGLIWQDRAMALKAIGDLATPESLDYLQKQKAALASRTDKDAAWTRDIIALYL